MTARFLTMFFVMVVATVATAQNNPHTTRTSGSCSPIVTGGSSQITIRCSGMSNEKANQMIELMNKILDEHLDLSEVNEKLNGLKSQIQDINATMNPLSGAPIEVVQLYEETQALMRECMNLHSESIVNSPKALQEYHQTLEPKLIVWKAHALRYVPTYSTATNFHDVASATDLGRVCMDVVMLQTAYIQQRQNQTLEKNATRKNNP